MKAIEPHDIARTVILALERMAFVLTDEVSSEEAESLPRTSHHARIQITGPNERILIRLSACTGFLTEFTASMLGLEHQDIDLGRLGDDALKELASVIGGEVVLLLGGTEAGLRLGMPETLVDPKSHKPDHAPEVTCHLDAGDQLLSFELFDVSAL